jgi:NADPH-dependent ferric siderophore reductase
VPEPRNWRRERWFPYKPLDAAFRQAGDGRALSSGSDLSRNKHSYMTQPNSAPLAEADPRQPQRVRHELRRRQLAVQAVEKISPKMVRVTLSGEELAGFTSLGFDDHVKLLFPVAAVKDADGQPDGVRAVVVAEVDSAADTLTFETKADASIHWVYRNGAEAGAPDLLSQALRKIDLPKGDYHAWVACESSAAKALRTQLLAEHGAQAQWTRAAGYWRRGVADVHDNLTD